MIGWFKKHGARIATVAVTAGAFVAGKFIPATAVITLGPLGIPVAALVDAGITALAAYGIKSSPNAEKAVNAIGNVLFKKR